MADAGGDDDWNAMGAGDARGDSDPGGPRDETVAGRSCVDAFEAGRQVRPNSRNRAGRLSRMRAADAGQPDGAGCLHADSRDAGRAWGFRSAWRAHATADAHGSAWSEGAAQCEGRRGP